MRAAAKKFSMAQPSFCALYHSYISSNFASSICSPVTRQFRMFVSSILGMSIEDFMTRNWKEALAEYPDIADEMADNNLIIELRPLYDHLRRARNSLAHGNGAIKYAELKKGIPNIIECIKYINQY